MSEERGREGISNAGNSRFVRGTCIPEAERGLEAGAMGEAVLDETAEGAQSQIRAWPECHLPA